MGASLMRQSASRAKLLLRANVERMDAIPAVDLRSGRPARLGRGAAARLVSRLARAALDTLYPPTCLACRAATDLHGALCPRCWSAMRFIERPVLRAARDAVRAGPRAGSPLAAGDGRSARLRPRPGRRAVRGRPGAHACPSAQIFRPRRARPADRALDGARGRGRAGRRRSPDAGAAASACGCGDGGSTRPRRWRRRFRARPASRAT